METLEDLFKNRSEEQISAFAFNTGKMIEELIRVNSFNAVKESRNLKSKILMFRKVLSECQPTSEVTSILSQYDTFFGIDHTTLGNTGKP